MYIITINKKEVRAYMLSFFKNKTDLKIGKLVRVIKYANLCNVDIEECDSMHDLNINIIMIKFENIVIKDMIKKCSFSGDEEHNIEIKILDKTHELVVYKSPIIYANNSSYEKLRISLNKYNYNKVDADKENVKWIYNGEWCNFIVSKIEELDLKIKNEKLEQSMEKKRREEEVQRITNDKIEHFNDIFRKEK